MLVGFGFEKLKLFVITIFMLAATTCFADDMILYSKYNIHTAIYKDGRYKASYANYTNPSGEHVIIPLGSRLVINDVSNRGFVFETDKDGKKIEVEFEYHELRMQMDVEKYIKLITSASPVSTENFSPEDQKGIREGKAFVGMSKNGILAALGYPATHRTPSLDASVWVYWTNRFDTVLIYFDGDKVSDVFI